MEVRCSNCGKPFYVKPYRIKRIKSEHGVCCSRQCSAEIKRIMYLGGSNPNHKYDKDIEFIYNLSHDGAYVLGLIYADGSVRSDRVTIYQDKEASGFLLDAISERIFAKNLVSYKFNSTVGSLTICDKGFVKFILSLGGIKSGKKSHIVGLPNIPEDKLWSFAAGYFDGDGGFKYNYKYPELSISSNSSVMLYELSKLFEVNYTGKNKIYASGNKALDICGRMYENVSFRHTKKYEYFMDLLNWQPMPAGPWFNAPNFKYKKLCSKTIAPVKNRVTDSGYDVCAVTLDYDEESGLYVADTQLAIQPIPGWYFDMVGRSSLPKTGFMFVGGVGVIDRSYVGPLKMLLKKIREAAVLPSVPFRLAQIIPRRVIHADFVEVDDLGDSDRGDGGFGSTGK